MLSLRRGCEGQVLEKHAVPFRELSASVEHKLASPVKLGIRSSYIFDKQESQQVFFDPEGNLQSQTKFVTEENLTLNPHFDLESKPVGIGVGYFWARHALTGSDDVDDVELPFQRAGTSWLHRRHLGKRHRPGIDLSMGLQAGVYHGRTAASTSSSFSPKRLRSCFISHNALTSAFNLNIHSYWLP